MTIPEYSKLSLFIGGQWRDRGSAGAVAVTNPATGDVLAELPCAGTADLDDALQAADEAFVGWRRTSAYDRANILRRAAQLIRQRVDEIAVILVMEEGKTLAEARNEILVSADVFEWCAEEGRRTYGRIVPTRRQGQRQLVHKVPLGPSVAFAPWNFPAVTPARKMAAALAAGCTCIIKPSEETPGTSLAFARALDNAGLPPGVLNVVFGDPETISTHLLASNAIRKMSFTGSTAVGKHLARLAADNLIKSTLELGGHAPVLIFDDADLDTLVPQAIEWKFRNAGQVCTSPTRFYVQEGIYDRFLTRFAEAARAIAVGNGLDRSSDMGPLANSRRHAAMIDLVEDARRAGAQSHVEGGPRGNTGLFWNPTVLGDVPDSARMMSEEPFGAIAIVNRFSTLEDGIQLANRLPYGLAAYAFTASHRNVVAIGEEVESGMIGINTFLVAMPETPFGGTKDSGYGSEGGIEGLDSYLETRFVNEAS